MIDWLSFEKFAGGVGLLVAAWVSLRSYLTGKKKQDGSSRLAETDQGVSIMQEVMTTLRDELARCEARCDEQIAELRAEWTEVRALLVTQVENLTLEVKDRRHEVGALKVVLTAANAVIEHQDIRIIELGGQPLGKRPPPEDKPPPGT